MREGAAKQKKKGRKNIFDIPFAPALFSFPLPLFSVDASIPAFLSSPPPPPLFHYPPARRIARNLSLSFLLLSRSRFRDMTLRTGDRGGKEGADRFQRRELVSEEVGRRPRASWGPVEARESLFSQKRAARTWYSFCRLGLPNKFHSEPSARTRVRESFPPPPSGLPSPSPPHPPLRPAFLLLRRECDAHVGHAGGN